MAASLLSSTHCRCFFLNKPTSSPFSKSNLYYNPSVAPPSVKIKHSPTTLLCFTNAQSSTSGNQSDGENTATTWMPDSLDFDERVGAGNEYGIDDEKWDPARYEALLNGGEQVTSVMQEMIELLEDMDLDENSEVAAVEIVAQGVIGKRVDQMEAGFMMALDYMIRLAEKDNDDKRKSILDVIKETVLAHLTKKCPPHVQVIGLLCRTPDKESRHELMCRVAGGGGVFNSEKSTKVQLPAANLNDIANQADDLIETMEARPSIPDRKLLARLVLIREESKNMMGGGILDERNDRGLSTLPEAEVNFISKLVALKPGKAVQEMIKNVMLGKDEGADNSSNDGVETSAGQQALNGIVGMGNAIGRKPRPVRPGMFLETVDKVIGGIYDGNVSGITAQHLEWVHQRTLQILQEMAF